MEQSLFSPIKILKSWPFTCYKTLKLIKMYNKFFQNVKKQVTFPSNMIQNYVMPRTYVDLSKSAC